MLGLSCTRGGACLLLLSRARPGLSPRSFFLNQQIFKQRRKEGALEERRKTRASDTRRRRTKSNRKRGSGGCCGRRAAPPATSRRGRVGEPVVHRPAAPAVQVARLEAPERVGGGAGRAHRGHARRQDLVRGVGSGRGGDGDGAKKKRGRKQQQPKTGNCW